MKEYLPLLENIYRENTQKLETIDAIAQQAATGDTGVLPNIKEMIIDYYNNADSEVNDITTANIVIEVSGNNYEQDSPAFEIKNIEILKNDNVVYNLTNDWKRDIETSVNNTWGEGWHDYAKTKETQDHLDDWINKGGY